MNGLSSNVHPQTLTWDNADSGKLRFLVGRHVYRSFILLNQSSSENSIVVSLPLSQPNKDKLWRKWMRLQDNYLSCCLPAWVHCSLLRLGRFQLSSIVSVITLCLSISSQSSDLLSNPNQEDDLMFSKHEAKCYSAIEITNIKYKHPTRGNHNPTI